MRKNCGFDNFSIFPMSTRTPLKDAVKTSTGNPHQALVSFKDRTFICDTTELQAIAIILFGARELEEKKGTKALSDLELSINCLQSQKCGSSGLSMKRSLKSFLQKRKQRNQASSPYNQ